MKRKHFFVLVLVALCACKVETTDVAQHEPAPAVQVQSEAEEPGAPVEPKLVAHVEPEVEEAEVAATEPAPATAEKVTSVEAFGSVGLGVTSVGVGGGSRVGLVGTGLGGGGFGRGGIASTRDRLPPANTEAYHDYGTQSFVDPQEDRFSTFGVDVDTGSYTIARRKLNERSMPPAASVRVEEFLNYFGYSYPQPTRGAFHVSMEAAQAPSA